MLTNFNVGDGTGGAPLARIVICSLEVLTVPAVSVCRSTNITNSVLRIHRGIRVGNNTILIYIWLHGLLVVGMKPRTGRNEQLLTILAPIARVATRATLSFVENHCDF